MNSDRGQSCASAQQGHVCLMRVATKGQLVAFLFFKLTFLLFVYMPTPFFSLLHALNKQEPAVLTSMTPISIYIYIYIYLYYD